MKYRIYILLYFSMYCLQNTAQRYTGYGRGSDYDFFFSGEEISYGFYISLLIIGIIYYLYYLLKEKFGKKEWTYKEFYNKKGGKIKIYKYDGVHISALIFGDEDTETVVFIQNRNKYINIDDICNNKEVRIKQENGIFMLYDLYNN